MSTRRLLLVVAGWLCLPLLPAAEPSAEELLQAATAAEQRGAPAEALVPLEKADALRPDEPAILQRLSQQCSDHSEEVPDPIDKIRWCTRALHYAQRAVALQPDDAANVLSLAIVYGKLAPLSDIRTRVEYARLTHDYATRALALDPTYDYAHHVLGRWHVEVASLPAPQRWVARVIYGGLPPASLADGIRHLREAVELAPAVPAHHAALGFALQADDQRPAARACFTRAAALMPRDHHDRLMQQRAQRALLRKHLADR
jgi:tetratricopeptide (TPR) repeat protein